MSWFPVASRSGESRSQLLAYPASTSTSKFLLDGIEFASGLEERARDAHLGLVERVPEEAKREILKELASEERLHYDMLSKVLISMESPPEERTGL